MSWDDAAHEQAQELARRWGRDRERLHHALGYLHDLLAGAPSPEERGRAREWAEHTLATMGSETEPWQ